VTPETCRVTVQ